MHQNIILKTNYLFYGKTLYWLRSYKEFVHLRTYIYVVSNHFAFKINQKPYKDGFVLLSK